MDKLEWKQFESLAVRAAPRSVAGVHSWFFFLSTRDINKAVANNPDKFPEGYIIRLQKTEKQELVENFHPFNKLKHSPVLPKAFSEKGLVCRQR